LIDWLFQCFVLTEKSGLNCFISVLFRFYFNSADSLTVERVQIRKIQRPRIRSSEIAFGKTDIWYREGHFLFIHNTNCQCAQEGVKRLGRNHGADIRSHVAKAAALMKTEPPHYQRRH